MKLFIASDLHGSAYYTRKMTEAFTASEADALLLLGDLLYHGPRNDLPKEYNPGQTADILNKFSDKIICVRGNCDSEVDQMLLDFHIMSDYTWIYDGNKRIFATHGHIYSKTCMPKLKNGDILLNGHFHIPENSYTNGIQYVNPGSVSIPKNDTKHSCTVYENGRFSFVEL